MKQKNIILGGLLAVLVVMGIAYAAFATQLNINGTASISSKWLVGFTNVTETCYNGYSNGSVTCSSTSTPASTTEWGTAFAAGYYHQITLNPVLKQNGDKVTYAITVKNGGNLGAKFPVANSSFTFAGKTLTSGNSATDGNVKVTYTNTCVTTYESSALAPNGTCAVTIVAEYTGTTATSTTEKTSAISGTINAVQA